MKIVSAAWFILVAQLALLPSGVTASCEDRTDNFAYKEGVPVRNWCLWIPKKFPDPADQLNQCAGRGLTDHCPVLCQKPECFATAAPTTAAPVPAPGPTPTPGGNNDLEILKQQVAQVAQQQVQLQADVNKLLVAVGDLSKFVMNPATSAPSEFHSPAPSTACQVPDPEFLGDGMCDGGEYNTEVCEYDKGDCDEFNAMYPNCNVPDPVMVGDGFCDDQHNTGTPVYNVAECGHDGGDCASGSA